MKKIIFISGIVTILSTLGLTIYKDIEIQTFLSINTAVLSLLYGWYQKLIKDDIELSMKLLKEDHAVEIKNVYSKLISEPEVGIKTKESQDISNMEVILEKPKRKQRTKKENK